MKLTRPFWTACACLYTFLLIVVSVKPVDMTKTPSTTSQMAHNLLHVPAYAMLAYLLIQSYGGVDGRKKTGIFLVAFAIGVFNEFLQSLTPTRQASLGDMGLNALGILLAIWVYKRIAGSV